MPQSHGSEPSRIGPISRREMGLGFRSERQRGQANQEHRTHGDAHVAHPVRSMEDDQRRHGKRAGGRHNAAHVVHKRISAPAGPFRS